MTLCLTLALSAIKQLTVERKKDNMICILTESQHSKPKVWMQMHWATFHEPALSRRKTCAACDQNSTTARSATSQTCCRNRQKRNSLPVCRTSKMAMLAKAVLKTVSAASSRVSSQNSRLCLSKESPLLSTKWRTTSNRTKVLNKQTRTTKDWWMSSLIVWKCATVAAKIWTRTRRLLTPASFSKHPQTTRTSQSSQCAWIATSSK